MTYAGTVTMSTRELNRLEVLGRVAERRLTQRRAAEQLGLSERQVRRLCRALGQQGAPGLVSRKRGHPSNRKLPAAVRERALGLVRARYADFGPTLAREKLFEHHGVAVSTETRSPGAGLMGAASSSRSTAATTTGSRTGVPGARCSSMWTTRRAG